MRNLLAILAILILLFSGLGFWRGWYLVESLPAESGRCAFRVEIDYQKLGIDCVGAGKSVIRAFGRGGDDKPAEGGK